MNRLKSKKGPLPVMPVLYGVFLLLYAAFTLLDAFVIPRDLSSPEALKGTVSLASMSSSSQPAGPETAASEEQASQPPSSSLAEEQKETSQPLVTETSYQSDSLSIQLTTLRRFDTQIYVAEIVLSSAGQLRSGLAEGMFGRNLSATTSQMAQENGAILAINGDYYGFRDEGFVLRNGLLYRDSARENGEALAILSDGSFQIVSESDTSAQALAEAGAVQIYSFGPGLLQNGQITVDADSEVEQSMRSNPRTAIGMLKPLHYLFVVSDGRTAESAGLTLLELAQVMEELGCEAAYNLDGGGSSTMWFMGRVVNKPTANGKRIRERSLSDIVYIAE